MEQTMRIVELESLLRDCKIVISQFINSIEEIKIFLEEDDAEGALNYISEISRLCYNRNAVD
jgi:hypothetical protein